MSDIQLPGATARITAETSGFRAQIAGAQQTLLGLEPIVASNWWGLQNLSRAFGAVGSAVAAGFGLAINEAVAWESAMTGVQRTTGASSAELEKIEADLRKVAQTTPIAVHELANLAEQAGALGIANDDIPAFVETMGNLIASTNLTTDSVDELARVMNVLQVPQESFERFASTLLEVGRSTAATETEILELAKRFAPTAAAAGLVADEVLAISAAVLSLGPRAEAGATGVNKTFYDMAAAISDGGDELALFAQVSNKSIEDFTRDFEQKPAQAFASFLTGLGNMSGGLIEMNTVLADLGITEVRQRQALIALAEGTKAIGDEQRNVNEILNLSKQAWRDNVALVEVAKQRYGTAAAQLQLFKNQISEAANQVGVALLPVLKLVVGVLQDLVFGFTSLNGPLKFVLVSIIGVIGVLSLLAGGIIAMVGPIVLALDVLRKLSAHFNKVGVDALGAAAQEKVQAQVTREVGATAVVAAEQLALFDRALVLTAQESAVASGQLALFGAEVGRAGTKAAVAGDTAVVATSKIGRFAKMGGALAGILSIAAIGLTLFGHKQRQAAEETEKAVKPNLQLVDAIDQQARGINNAADEWLLQQSVMSGAIEIATRLKITMADLFAVIKGTANTKFAQKIVDDLSAAAAKGGAKGKEAEELLRWTAEMNATWRESASASGHLKTARGQLGVQNKETADSERELGAATDKTREKQEKANQATMDLVGALLQQRVAALDVKEAQQAYADALEDAANANEAIAAAEAKVTAERITAEKAQRDLEKAERNLATAREQAIEDLADAEDALADARDRHADALDKIQDAEEKLDKLRNGPTIRELTNAVNDLARAQNNLRKAEQGVEDAEWQIAFLRAEGASDRALKDAEGALADARVNLADETQNVTEAEEDLNKLRNPSTEDIIKAERDLEGARRDASKALREIKEREQDLADQREDIANDQAYKDAQLELAEAQAAVHEATNSVKDAERELRDLRAGSLNDEVLRAEQDLLNALVNQAKAATDVWKQTKLMRGEFVDAGAEAQELARQLGIALNQAPTDATRNALTDYIGILRQAKALAEKGEGGGGGSSAGGGGFDSPTFPPPKFPEPKDMPTNSESWWKKLLDPGTLIGIAVFGDMLRRIFSGTVIGRALSGLRGALSTAVITGLRGALTSAAEAVPALATRLPYVLVAAIVGAVVVELLKTETGQKILRALYDGLLSASDWLTNALTENGIGKWLLDPGAWSKTFDELKQKGRDMVSGLWEGFIEWFTENELFKDPGKWFMEHLVEPIERWLGIKSPSTVFAEIGRNLMRGLFNGIVEKFVDVFNWFRELPGKIRGWVADAGGWIYSHGSEMIGGMLRGAIDRFRELGEWLRNLPGMVAGGVGDMGHLLYKGGRDIIRGLAEGLESMKDWILEKAKKVGNWVKDGVETGIGWLIPGSPSRFGLAVGEGIGLGVEKGTKDILPMVRVAAQSFAKSIEEVLTINPDLAAQFDDRAFSDLAARAAANSGGWGTTPSSSSQSVVKEGDTFNITGADERSAVEISEEVMFKKLVRTGG